MSKKASPKTVEKMLNREESGSSSSDDEHEIVIQSRKKASAQEQMAEEIKELKALLINQKQALAVAKSIDSPPEKPKRTYTRKAPVIQKKETKKTKILHDAEPAPPKPKSLIVQ